MMGLNQRVQNWWYAPTSPLWPLIPAAKLFQGIACLRRLLFNHQFLKQHHFSVPVIVVGNLTAGGTGKTPLVLYLAELFKKQGLKPGIVSRGYKSQIKKGVYEVTPTSDPKVVGDEPVLMAQKSGCPVVIGPKRVQALQFLIECYLVDVVISDDGLQHYALARDIEIAVVDHQRQFGNGYCLPAGPLREPTSRLNTVDIIVSNGGDLNKSDNISYAMQFETDKVYSGGQEDKKLLSDFSEQTVHAVTGIGHPDRFFNQLRAAGLNVIEHAFPDHYSFSREDIHFPDDNPVFMTDKDYVKCRPFVSKQHWVVPVTAKLTPTFDQKVLHLFKRCQHG